VTFQSISIAFTLLIETDPFYVEIEAFLFVFTSSIHIVNWVGTRRGNMIV